MSSRSIGIDGKPRRKHKLKQGASTTPPQSPFVSPLRFAKQKSLLRISSPKGNKASLTNMIGGLPLEETSKEMPWDENDEAYPEVQHNQTTTPQHLQPAPDLGDSEDDDGISSVSSGSKNGEIRIPNDDDPTDEEWEFKDFGIPPETPASATAPTPKRSSVTKKVSKVLGKHRKLFFKKKKKKDPNNNNNIESSQRSSGEQSLQPESSSSLKGQHQSEPLQVPPQQQPQPQVQALAEPSLLPQQQQPQAPEPPLPQPQPQQAPQKTRQQMLSPIRIKRPRNKVQQHQSPDAESEKEPRQQQILKGRHRPEVAVRSDALWTQTAMTEPSSDHEDEGAKENAENAADNAKQSTTTEEEQPPEQEDATPDNTAAAASDTLVRSDALWAQNLAQQEDSGHQEVESHGFLTPSPKTPTATEALKVVPPSQTTTISDIPFGNSDDDEEEGNDHDDHDNDDEKENETMTTGQDTTTFATTTTATTAVRTGTPSSSETGKVVDESDLEDGNIVDEDDLLNLSPSDEHDRFHREEGEEVVPERNQHSSDMYLPNVLSEDEDEYEGGVVSEQDEEKILEESVRNSPKGPSHDDDVILSEVLSNSNSVLAPSEHDQSEEYRAPSEGPEDEKSDKFQMQALQDKPEASNTANVQREAVGENLDTTISSNFTLDDSDLAELEKEKPRTIGERSTLTNMQHRLLALRTIKDTYKRKLLLQEQESVQLQVQLLASQYEAKEAKMSLQNAEAALANERSKLIASENERQHQKVLLQNLQEQLAIVTAHLQKSKETNPPRRGTMESITSFHSETIHSAAYDKKLASMEEQLLVQDEEMDQLAAQIQELKQNAAELEQAKGLAEQKLEQALAREKSLKAQLKGHHVASLEPISGNGESPTDDLYQKEIQRLEKLIEANEERFQAESEALSKQLEDVQKQHELEIARLQLLVETNKKLADSASQESEAARTKLLQELADSKLQHAKAIEELRESLSKAYQEEKAKLHTQYTNELERLEEEIVGARSELSV